ncbi:hypothetical protein EDD21DRAFT_368077 [Dissophora ornata]|nr:hypothetical protein EDD21DRAFT_368077 [Dissophora ornata]
MITITPSSLRFRRPLLAIRTSLATALLCLQQRTYSVYDIQYAFLLILFTFCYCVMDKPVWLKLPIALIAVALLVPKQTRPFMMPFLAIAGWLILFYTCRFIPAEWRPHIYTSVLPALDNIIYGDNLSDLLASSTAPWKDLLAWLPYGIFHFVMPIVVAVLIALFAPPGTLPVFARTFGYMNVAGVMTQLLFPCAPPWYETRYGPLQPAAYSMPGDPGGLTRVDDILGTDMYRSTFTASPLVFGAFPSLHSGCAWQLAFFTVFVFGPRSIPFALIYVFWIWWAAMYLSHHYVVDLVGGSVYAIIAFWIGSSFLPSVLPHEDTRLSSLEKQSFFKDSEYALVGGGKDWDSADDDSDNEATEDSDDTVVVDISNEMETNLSSKSVLAKDRGTPEMSFQSWNGWQGYESWAMVLKSMRSGNAIPRDCASPRYLLRRALQGSPLGSITDLTHQSPYSMKEAISLETICSGTETAACSSSGRLASPTVNSSLPTALPTVLDTSSSSNIPIPAAAEGAAEDSGKRLSRSFQLSLLNSSSGPAPNSPSKSNFLEQEVIATSVTLSESIRESGVNQLLTGSGTPGLFVSTTIMVNTPGVNMGRRRKDD